MHSDLLHLVDTLERIIDKNVWALEQPHKCFFTGDY